MYEYYLEIENIFIAMDCGDVETSALMNNDAT